MKSLAAIAVAGVLATAATAAMPDNDNGNDDSAHVVAAGQDVAVAEVPASNNSAGVTAFRAADRAAQAPFNTQRAIDAAAEQAAAEQAAADQAAAEQAAADQAAAAAEQAAAEQAAAEQAAADQAAADQAAAEQAAAEQAAAAAEASTGSRWDRLADCESGNWDGNGHPVSGSARWDYGLEASHDAIFEGGVQFHPGTWDAFRSGDMPGHAGNASRSQQIAVAEQVLAAQGWGAWPVCSRKIGLR